MNLIEKIGLRHKQKQLKEREMKQKFLIKLVFIIVYLTICIASSYANEKKETTSTLSTFFELGEKFTDVFGYENSDVADDIMYYRYSTTLEQKVTPAFSYTIGELVEGRDYDGFDQFDNKFTQTTASMKYKFGESDSFIVPQELRSSYMYKHKDYVHNTSSTDNNDYVQNKFTLGISYIGEKENWRIDYDTGINSLDYSLNTINNENKTFNQIQAKKKFLSDKLTASAGYKISYADRRNKDNRTEPEGFAGIDFKPSFKYLGLLSFRYENGKSETREEDAREDIYDYRYERLISKAEIALNSKLKNTFVHKIIRRKYMNFNKSYRYLSLEDTTRYTQIDDKAQALYYELYLEYKESDFILYDPSNYKKITEGVTITYDRKKNWKIKSGLTFRRKEFTPNPLSDFKQLTYTLGLEKTLTPDLSLAFDLRKEWKDYYRGPGDRTLDAYKINLNYRF